MKKLLSLRNVCKSFESETRKNEVLDNISFDIFENEIVSIIGPSGCGKSTILNIISKLDNNFEGEIDLLSKTGYMFQKDCLLPWKNVLDNIKLGLEIKKGIDETSLSYINSLIEKYGLKDFIHNYPNELSGGMRQRVSLIRTLSLSPDLLLMDEPFSALDYQTKLFVQEDVYKILKKEKKSALIVTHDISEAIALSSRIIILSKRPCKILKNIDIHFKTQSPNERRIMPKFQEYYHQIESILRTN